MDIGHIENNLQALLSDYSEDSFVFGLLSAYGIPNASIARLKKGDFNQSKNSGEVLWKNKIFFKTEKGRDLHAAIDEARQSQHVMKQRPRFVVVTDFSAFLAIDTQNSDSLDIPLKDLARHFDFFLPLAGMEKTQLQTESLADIKAAERMGRFYDLVLAENPVENDQQRHELNVFFTRLLFCFFAEDTGIFPKGIFVNGIGSHTNEDGSDLQGYLSKLFRVLNTEDRTNCSRIFAEYPYVNGGLFATESPVPRFNAKARNLLLECAALNWKAINPDIFGSMMQAVVHTSERTAKGMHYTSVANIMKVIEPLFLTDLKGALDEAGSDERKLNQLLSRIYNLRLFDPACGSGNFLIIAYKELCRIEIEIFKRLHKKQMVFRFRSNLKLSQFHGIEIDDFAREIATLSLWLTQHQMNLAFREVFGEARPTLPLSDAGNIVCGNAALLHWEGVCPAEADAEIYLLGNPPYLGQRNQTERHQAEMDSVFNGLNNYKNLDYIAIWFIKAGRYCKLCGAKFAFVTTNSVCQGTQVEMLWPHLFQLDLEIYFAYRNIHWSNNARNNAGVTISIVGVRRRSSQHKTLFTERHESRVSNINPYLIEGKDIIVSKRREPLSMLPKMDGGNQPREGGHLILTDVEAKTLLSEYGEVRPLLRTIVGSDEFLNGILRWCIWIREDQIQFASSFPPIRERIEAVRELRSNGNTLERNFKNFPHRFVQINEAKESQIVVPVVSSERRDYIPIGLLGRDSIVLNSANVIFDPETYIFGVVSSRIHNVWVRAVAGRMRNDIRYTPGVCFNSFPFPPISDQSKTQIADCALEVLDVRERYPELTIARLYDPEAMPSDLREAHRQLDSIVDCCYRARPFGTDEERLTHLFGLYEAMCFESVEKEKSKCQISLM